MLQPDLASRTHSLDGLRIVTLKKKKKKKVVFSAITRFSNTKSLESVSESVFKSDLCRPC